MDGVTLQDRITKGLGRAARKLGQPFVVYRPGGVTEPLASRNRIIKLSAWFEAGDGTTPSAGSAFWHGVFDASYTRPGDYLVGSSGTFFIASQDMALPVQCVRTNRVVSIVRGLAPVPGDYGGLYGGALDPLISAWPASLLRQGAYPSAGGVHETRFASWSLLLPALPVAPQVGDVVRDDRLQTYAVGAAEEQALGWRMIVRQVGA